MLTPHSVSPALIAPAPMARTAILPASAMESPVHPQMAILGLNWAQIPGSASQVAASPDGSLWALSTLPSGADKYIWHYVSGAWTNISGMAAYLAVAPNGTLYAVNSGGGTYAYSGTWTALGGGASGITAASDGSIYVLTNGGSSADKAIWHNVSGSWSQVPGSGVTLGASWDTGGPFAGVNGTIKAGGFYILNSIGAIWYENTDGTFAQLPGAASAIAPTVIGGVFVLGYPANSGGNAIYYYDFNTSAWNTQSGTGVSIATNTSKLYVVSSSSAIYSTAIATAPQTLYVPMYTSDNTASISEWPTNASGNVTPSVKIAGAATTLLGPTAVTRDSSGYIYVADFDNAAVDVFAPGSSGNVAPVRQIRGSSTAINGLEGIGVDSSGNIYLANRNTNSITVYSPSANGNAAPTRTIVGASTGFNSPQQLIVNPTGDFYIANASTGGTIEYFAAGANGNVAPTRTISNSSTGTGNGFGMALDFNGSSVYSLSGAAIYVYPASSNGSVAAARTISGSNTTLSGSSAEGIAVDSAGNIYVTECSSSSPSIVVFAAGANGNVTPTATITGAATGIKCPLKPAVF